MNIGILGTGVVGKALAGKLSALGHAVKLGTRDVKATLQRNEADMLGGPNVRTWLEAHPKVTLGTLHEAAAHGQWLVNALSGHASLEGLKLAGSDNLAGKILIDVANPLDFSKGMPPTLTVSNTDSLGEQIQREFPKAKVVKTLNTLNAGVMVTPEKLGGGDHSVFVCGNDAGAKAEVTRLLKEELGWRDVIDLGDIGNARGTEMWLALWVRLMGSLKTANFNLKIVR